MISSKLLTHWGPVTDIHQYSNIAPDNGLPRYVENLTKTGLAFPADRSPERLDLAISLISNGRLRARTWLQNVKSRSPVFSMALVPPLDCSSSSSNCGRTSPVMWRASHREYCSCSSIFICIWATVCYSDLMQAVTCLPKQSRFLPQTKSRNQIVHSNHTKQMKRFH